MAQDIEIEVQMRIKRRIRVPLIAGFAVVQQAGHMSRIFDIGKARAIDMYEAGVALLGRNQEVLVEDAKGRKVFRRRNR